MGVPSWRRSPTSSNRSPALGTLGRGSLSLQIGGDPPADHVPRLGPDPVGQRPRDGADDALRLRVRPDGLAPPRTPPGGYVRSYRGRHSPADTLPNVTECRHNGWSGSVELREPRPDGDPGPRPEDPCRVATARLRVDRRSNQPYPRPIHHSGSPRSPPHRVPDRRTCTAVPLGARGYHSPTAPSVGDLVFRQQWTREGGFGVPAERYLELPRWQLTYASSE